VQGKRTLTLPLFAPINRSHYLLGYIILKPRSYPAGYPGIYLSELAQNSFIGIGFCYGSVDLNRLPGWEKGSWGYHGDDGNSYASQGIGKSYGPTFTTGDIIGCGIDFQKGFAFYTKNGLLLDVAFSNLIFIEVIFPTIGLKSSGEHVRVNFGKEAFKFDIISRIKYMYG
jgi:Ran-binding protein 9/10